MKMNEKIKELAERAGSTHKQNLGVYQFFEHELESFVELIVQDCCRMMQGFSFEEIVVGVLKTRFGVEE
jgi:hypothetical protein